MKLRNKRTGEMGIINYFDNQSIVIYPIDENWDAKGDKKYVYHSLAELNKEWCDYEEPKVPCFINWFGEVSELLGHISDREIEKLKEAGNYFETKEEAEKAVERLRAWKRLKDKGLRFCGHDDRDRGQLGDIVIYAEMSTFEYDDDLTKDDLDLLFGGEE